MLCSDTGETKAYRVEGVTAAEGEYVLKWVATVRSTSHGTGEICIPILGRKLKRLKVTIEDFFETLHKS